MLDLPEPDYAPRFRLDDPRGFVESYVLKANSPGGNRAIGIRHTIRVPAGRPEDAVAEVWAAAYHRGDPGFPVAVRTASRLDAARFRPRPFRAEHDCAVLEAGRARGEIKGRRHTIGWSLEFDGTGPTHYPYPLASMYTGRFPSIKTLTPIPDTSVLGAIEVDGQRWVLSGWRGTQSHRWGPQQTSEYAFIHCGAFEGDDDGFLEAVATRLPIGRDRWISCVTLSHRGEAYRFDAPLSLARAEVRIEPRHIRFRTHAHGASLSGVVLARREEMTGRIHDNPDGTRLYGLAAKTASARFVLERSGRAPIELRSRQCALEVGTRRVDHGVRQLI